MQTRPGTRGPRRLAAALSKATRATFRRRGFAHAGVLSRWPEIVGEELATMSCPEKLSFPPGRGDGGTLQVRVAGGFATELQHLEPLVIERINTFFGYAAIGRLALKQGPLPAPRQARGLERALGRAEQEALGARVAATADQGLKSALLELGRRIAASLPAAERRE